MADTARERDGRIERIEGILLTAFPFERGAVLDLRSIEDDLLATAPDAAPCKCPARRVHPISTDFYCPCSHDAGHEGDHSTVDGVTWADDSRYALATAPDAARLTEALEGVLMDATVTYGIIGDDGTATPMLVERLAIVKAMGYEDESAWLARTAEINAARGAAAGAAREGTRS